MPLTPKITPQSRTWRAAGAMVSVLLAVAAFALVGHPLHAHAQEATPATVAPDESTGFQMNAAHDGSLVGGSEKPPLVKKWVRDLGGPVSYPLITNGRVFVTTSDGAGNALHALDVNTGQDV